LFIKSVACRDTVAVPRRQFRTISDKCGRSRGKTAAFQEAKRSGHATRSIASAMCSIDTAA